MVVWRKRLLGGDHFLLYQAESSTKWSRSLSSKSQQQASASTRASLKFRGWTEVKSGDSRAGLYHKRAKRCVWRLLEGTAIVPPVLHNCKLQQISVRRERKANEIPKGRRRPYSFAKPDLKWKRRWKYKTTKRKPGNKRGAKMQKKRRKAFGQRPSLSQDEFNTLTTDSAWNWEEETVQTHNANTT